MTPIPFKPNPGLGYQFKFRGQGNVTVTLSNGQVVTTSIAGISTLKASGIVSITVPPGVTFSVSVTQAVGTVIAHEHEPAFPQTITVNTTSIQISHEGLVATTSVIYVGTQPITLTGQGVSIAISDYDPIFGAAVTGPFTLSFGSTPSGVSYTSKTGYITISRITGSGQIHIWPTT